MAWFTDCDFTGYFATRPQIATPKEAVKDKASYSCNQLATTRGKNDYAYDPHYHPARCLEKEVAPTS